MPLSGKRNAYELFIIRHARANFQYEKSGRADRPPEYVRPVGGGREFHARGERANNKELVGKQRELPYNSLSIQKSVKRQPRFRAAASERANASQRSLYRLPACPFTQ